MVGAFLGNLRIRLLVLILIILVPALSLIFYTTSGEVTQEKEHAAADALNAVKVAAMRHEQYLEATRQLLVVLAHLPQVRKGNTTGCNSAFAGLLKECPYYLGLGATDLNGCFFCSSHPGREPSDLADKRFFREAVETKKSTMSRFYPGPPAGKPSVVVAHPIQSDQGEVTSVVLASIDLDWFNQLASRAELPREAEFTIIDSAGTVLAHYPDAQKRFGTLTAQEPLVRTILEKKQGVIEQPGLDGVKRLNAFMPLFDAFPDAAYMSVGIPLPLAYQEADEAIPRGLIGGSALLLAFAAWFFGDLLLLKRLRTLKAATKSLAAGDLTARTGVSSPREDVAADLMRSFDEMAEAMHDQQEALRNSEAKYRLLSEGTITAMACAVESRDPYTAGHQRRVAQIAAAIARQMGLDAEMVEGIRMAGFIHDIGKIAVPTDILSKPGKIDDDEFALIRRHSKTGFDILKPIDFPWPVAQIVYQHHERLDGSGYPRKLTGGEILTETRIICVADVIEAMACHRPYRAALGMDAALREITSGRGTVYDPRVVDACVELIRKGLLDDIIKQ